MLVVLQANVNAHEGLYTCIASNAADSDEKDTSITVLSKLFCIS